VALFFWTLIDITARKGLCQTYDRPEIISATTAVKVAEAEELALDSIH